MSKRISLPMYDLRQRDTLALLQALRTLLHAEGVDAPLSLDFPADLPQHWSDPEMLLSQTCGYPLYMLMPDVQVVGTFHYRVAGCAGFCYSSQLVVREAEAGQSLRDFRQRRVVCNSADSQSGYHSLRGVLAALHQDGRFFSPPIFSGSHRQSLAAIRADEADIAAIDAVSWALLQRHYPDETRGLASIGTTPLIPGLPLIAAAHTSPHTLRQLRRALHRLVSEPQWRSACEAFFIDGFTATDRQDYLPVYHNARRAADSGLIAL